VNHDQDRLALVLTAVLMVIGAVVFFLSLGAILARHS
jgi:hypothetical protein